MAKTEYQRLSRAQRRPGVAVAAGFSSLWLGKDHLLTIESTGYTEEYKRFYFRDIQAITIRGTKRRMVTGLVMGVITLIFAIIGLAVGDGGGAVFCWIMAGVMGVLFVINLAAGPTTTCYLRSAVQTEELPSLGRLRNVKKAMARLRPLIVAAQGEIAPETAATRMKELLAKPVPGGEASPSDPPSTINA